MKQYERAEANYREALKIRHNSLTAKNGLAISLQRQDKYNREALNLARFTYNQQPTNPYFIVTYFKFWTVSSNRLMNKHLTEYLKSNGND